MTPNLEDIILFLCISAVNAFGLIHKPGIGVSIRIIIIIIIGFLAFVFQLYSLFSFKKSYSTSNFLKEIVALRGKHCIANLAKLSQTSMI